MNDRFKRLLAPGNIGSLELKNRIVTAPMWNGYGGVDGSVTPRTLTYYSEKARGGPGLIIVEFTYIDEIASKSVPNQLAFCNDEYNSGMTLLVQAIHDGGAKCAIQLGHAGAMRFLPDPPWMGPSDGEHDLSPMGPFPPLPITGLSKDEIAAIVTAFGEAAGRAKRVGFDMLELHAAHGYLTTEFLSPHFNKRTDEYGGSPEKRMRFPLEVIGAMRAAVGPGFPISVRFNGTDYAPEDPITIEEAILFSRKLEEAGVDALHVSGGTDVYLDKLLTTTYQARAFNVYLAEEVKKKSGVKIPVIATGAITTPDLAEEILADGKADFIALGRQTLADPNWVKKTEEGRPEDIIPCIRCNDGCQGRVLLSFRGTTCTVNPRTGFEMIRSIAPLEKKKKVVVIGGGPGGMEAARVATLRGHDVILYEKRDLGGAMIEASWDPAVKTDLKFLIAYYRTQMKKLNINIIKKKATTEIIVNGGYDVAIVANGAVPRKFEVPGSDKSHVCEAIEVTRDKKKDLGKSVIVIGGGVLASEIAVSQALLGRKVFMKAPEGCHFGENEIAGDLISTRRALLELMKANNVEINMCLLPKEITDNGVVSIDMEGNEQEFKADSVIICRGFLPDKSMSNALRGKVKEIIAIGDCVEARKFYDAIHEGWVAGNRI